MTAANAPILETQRLILRGHEADDFPALAACWADPEVYRHISGQPSTPEESWSRLLRYAGMWRVIGFGYWAVTARKDGQYLGDVGFADFHREMTPSFDGRPEAGWVLVPSAHGRGLASEAVARITRWADETLEAGSTACMMDPEHDASRRVAEKCGYREEGIVPYRGRASLVMGRPRKGTAG